MYGKEDGGKPSEQLYKGREDVYKRQELRRDAAKNSNANQNYPDPSEAITDKKGFIISTIIFLCAVCLLVTHAQTGLCLLYTSGIIDLISELFRCGIINPKGKFVREGKRVRFDKYGMGSYVIVFQEDAASVKDVEINEVDIDNFIRAKGAIFSAIRVMLNSLDFTVDMIDDVYVAGGRCV